MGDNRDLFNPPIARRSDPATSKAAAAAYTESGKRGNDKAAVLEAIARHPGSTSRELAHVMKDAGTLPWDVAVPITTKRVSDLLHDGRIFVGKTRLCSKSNRPARTYYASTDTL